MHTSSPDSSPVNPSNRSIRSLNWPEPFSNHQPLSRQKTLKWLLFEKRKRQALRLRQATYDLSIVSLRQKKIICFSFLSLPSLLTEDADYSVEDEEIEEYRFLHPTAVAELLPNYYAEAWSGYIART